MGEEGFIREALVLAARNKNLILPELGKNFCLVAAGDVVEAALCLFCVRDTRKNIENIGKRN